jgi:hypothetical protein
VVGAMLTARTGLHSEFMRLHRQVLAIVRTLGQRQGRLIQETQV